MALVTRQTVPVTETDEQRLARLRAELADVERRYAEAEGTRADRSATTARRGPVSLIAVCLGVALVVGVVAAVDLRRLQTPAGTALAWTGAAVFGDCTAYRELLLVTPAGDDPDAVCLALREATVDNREQAGEVGIEVVAVEQDGDAAVATVRLDRPDEPISEVDVPLRRTGDDWQVVLTDEVCAELFCA